MYVKGGIDVSEYKMSVSADVEKQIWALDALRVNPKAVLSKKLYIDTEAVSSGRRLAMVRGRDSAMASLAPLGLYVMIGFPDPEAKDPLETFLDYGLLSGEELKEAMALAYAAAERLDPDGVGAVDINLWGLTWSPSFHIHLRFISFFGKQYERIVRIVFNAGEHRAELEAHSAELAKLRGQLGQINTPVFSGVGDAIARLKAIQESFDGVVAGFIKQLKPAPPEEK